MLTLYLPDVVGLLGLLLNVGIVHHFVHDAQVAWQIYGMMVGSVLVLLAFRRWQARLGEEHRLHRTFDWWILLAGLAVYLNIRQIVDAVGRPLIDSWLISRDQTLFGGQASVWLSHHMNPWATEFFYTAYASYYGWIALTGMALARVGRRPFHAYVTAIGITFFVMLLGYMSFPAIGPRFTEAVYMAEPLRGVWLGVYLDADFKAVPFIKDCMPSGHTLQTLVAVYFAWRYLSRGYACVMSFAAAAIVASTLYLRMHYGTDLLCALPLVVGGVGAGEYLSRRFSAVQILEGRRVLTNQRSY